jgi:hypothetical protein
LIVRSDELALVCLRIPYGEEQPMADQPRWNQPAQSEVPANPPNIIDLGRIETTNGLDSINESSVRYENLTEAKLTYETPKAREAREQKEIAAQKHANSIDLIKTIMAGVLLLGFFAFGVYLAAFKQNANEADHNLATVILTAIATGIVAYLFGKQDRNKSDKEQ